MNGRVFAVSWRGLKRPDLSVLLGKFYEEYEREDKSHPAVHGRQPILVKTSQIVVQRGGRMRNIYGLAFIRNEIPEGVTLEQLQ